MTQKYHLAAEKTASNVCATPFLSQTFSGNLGTRTGVTRRPAVQPSLSAHFSTPTAHCPVFSRSPGHQLAMLSGLHKSGTLEVLAQAAPDVGGFQHPTQMKCYFRLCSGIWTFSSTQHRSTSGSIEASACAHLSLTCTLSWRRSFRARAYKP